MNDRVCQRLADREIHSVLFPFRTFHLSNHLKYAFDNTGDRGNVGPDGFLEPHDEGLVIELNALGGVISHPLALAQ